MSATLKPLRQMGPECVSDWTLDALLAADLDAEEARAVERHLGACLPCRRRYQELVDSRESFLSQAPGLPARRPGWWRSRPAAALGGLALAASVAFAVVYQVPQPEGESVRLKGDAPSARAYLVRQGAVSQVSTGASLRPGDEIQLVYSSATARQGALLGVDGTGRARVYFPQGRSDTAPIAAGRNVTWPAALRLDVQPGPEMFAVLFCDRPRALEPVRKSLEISGERAQWPEGCSAELFTFAKKLP